MQTRRGFLKMLGVGVVAAPLLVKAATQSEYRGYVEIEGEKVPILVSEENRKKLNRLFDQVFSECQGEYIENGVTYRLDGQPLRYPAK